MFPIIFIFVLFFYVIGVGAQTATPTTPLPRVASCDLCGYCPIVNPQPNVTPNPIPGNWEKCRDCLYPTLNGYTAEENKTLEIDPTTGLPPAPVSGFMYTGIGCIGTNLQSFTSSGGVSGVVQVLFNFIVTLAGGVAFLTIIYGAFILITSQSNPEKLDQGKRLIMGAAIGLIFILFSAFIVNFLAGSIFNIGTFK